MLSYRTRETRQAVSIGARLRKEAGWGDAVIRNVSTRGLMAACMMPPGRGEYVELRCGSQVIVAQVMWVRHGRFGARVRDRINLEELGDALGQARPPAIAERRQLIRMPDLAPRRRTMAEREESSRRLGRKFDFVSIGLAGAVLAVLVAGIAREALEVPLGRVTQALSIG